MRFEVSTPCISGTSGCHNCCSHFMHFRPNIRTAILTKHFLHDMGEEKAKFMVQNILDCSHEAFAELHKFEENVNGYNIFRAKHENSHIVYSIAENKIVFLRAFSNFKEYRHFLNDR
ncbi:hypothetical protein JXA85_06795, partial [Candidatus Woesearchaeota archaeon]|nr:hypothetical protein [Candidatus Woesearchaeota archaeon]